MKTVNLSVIIVNYYSEKLVENCISSLLTFNKEGLEIIIVDNGSHMDLASQYDREKVKVITNQTNMGFGSACNIGAKYSKSQNILFLNPDTSVFENTIQDAIDFFNQNTHITVLGCQQVNEEGKVLKTCTTFVTFKTYLIKSFYLDKLLPRYFRSHLMTYWDHLDSRFVDHVMGSFYMIRKEDFNALKGFDEDYFVYYEDLDLSKRVKNRGGKIYFNADLRIYHKTGGTSERVKAKRLSYSLEGILIYARKHFSNMEYALLFLFILTIEFLLRICFSILNLNVKSISEVLKGYALLYRRIFFSSK